MEGGALQRRSRAGSQSSPLRSWFQPRLHRNLRVEQLGNGAAAQLPTFLRGLYYEGWKPSKVPIKMSRQDFLDAVQEKIVTEQVVDPVRITQSVFAVIMSYVGA